MSNIINMKTLKLLICSALLLLGVAYLISKVLLDLEPVDFSHIWLAGYLWNLGKNPYSAEFLENARVLFAGRYVPWAWVYPPNWWPLASLSALTSFETAGFLWRILSAFMVLGGCAALSFTAYKVKFETGLWRHFAFASYICLMSATAISFSLGQTSPVIFLGTCIYASAWLLSSRGLMIVALSLLALKPNIGLVFAAVLVPSIFWWPSLIFSGGVAILSAVPAFVMHGTGDVLLGMISTLSDYGKLGPNSPLAMTGVRHLLYKVSGYEISSLLTIVLGIVGAIGLGYWARRRKTIDQKTTVILVLLPAVPLMVPVHIYDAMLLAPLVLLSAILVPSVQIAIAAALVLTLRPNNLEVFLNFAQPITPIGAGVLVISLVSLILTLVLLANLFRAGSVHSGSYLHEPK